MTYKYNDLMFLYYMKNHIEVLYTKQEERNIKSNKGPLIAIVISTILTFVSIAVFVYTLTIHWQYAYIFIFAAFSCLIVALYILKGFRLAINYSLTINENGICEIFSAHQKKTFKWSDVKYIAFYEKGATTGAKSASTIYSACVISTAIKSEKEYRRVVKKGVAVTLITKLPKGYIAVYGENAELTKELYEKIQDYIPDDVKENIVFEVD